jgi:hypothetical protein
LYGLWFIVIFADSAVAAGLSHLRFDMEPMQDQRRDWVDSLRDQRGLSNRDWHTALLLSILLGIVGADRFYVGRTGLGVLKLVTFGGYFVWWVVDVIVLLQGRMKDDLGKVVRRPEKRWT